ncbi:MAG: hypothetical protein U0892_06490 [Pirellulales bacterium]
MENASNGNSSSGGVREELTPAAGRRRPRAKWLVFAVAGFMCAGVLGASLRQRPRID